MRLFKILIVTIITISILIISKNNNEIKELIYKNIYQDNINFVKLNKIYNKYLGNIKFIEKESKVSNIIMEYKNKDAVNGVIKLEFNNDYPIQALEEGFITYIGDKDKYNNVVIVSLEDNTELWYCNINNINVKLYDYIYVGDILGDSNLMYLIHKKDNKIIDYEI